MKTQLTMELLREFLGGLIEIDNPNCQYLGIPGEVCLDQEDVAKGKIRWIGVRFRWLMEIINGRPVGKTKKPNCVLEFNLIGTTHTGLSGKRECLVIPTDIQGEEVKIMK
ncbi:MAG: hypothetical protein A3G03_00290 [Candidatus Taylorbacteria bacterium RIFCSPLOWO2_12_FULL_44_15c]|uniref:Uncharacterized protein n=1 Tax=Candidatus Taylorbacteria bacterium RIFCSPLOWO2_12_FULL_44_15c TaxID=1802333 RepID=A0A1G2P459_9BACT|nr:MAG: hypothetical protein A3I97_01940 [Candidatus Taylorbacteria bacterium RIFCSPLOWO2_02_FULL_44_35]OHA43147.1 MAG: hypothetical protein A3G03_00290 [Candidatus Taylorbacteria bacterium RIFCSPLOWO2_12_FULL_44_15c]